jgi:hypothetical protein
MRVGSSKSKEKLEFWFVIDAIARFSCDKPDNWDEMSREEKISYVEDKARCEGSLCNHCADTIQSNYEVDAVLMSEALETDYFPAE